MKKYKALILLTAMITMASSCNWVKGKAKKTVNKTGEIVAKTGSEFGDGVYKGIKETFRNNVQLSSGLQKEGLALGEVTINSTDTTSDNVLTVYLIFNKDFDKNITAKVFNSDDEEFGRTTHKVQGKAGNTQYFDFVFDKRVHIGVKGKVVME